MILEKDEFISVMSRIAEVERGYDMLTDAMKLLGEEWQVGFDATTTVLLEVLDRMFEDDEGWIGYFYCEMDCGANYGPGKVTIDGKEVPLKDAGDLWELLVARMKG